MVSSMVWLVSIVLHLLLLACFLHVVFLRKGLPGGEGITVSLIAPHDIQEGPMPRLEEIMEMPPPVDLQQTPLNDLLDAMPADPRRQAHPRKPVQAAMPGGRIDAVKAMKVFVNRASSPPRLPDSGEAKASHPVKLFDRNVGKVGTNGSVIFVLDISISMAGVWPEAQSTMMKSIADLPGDTRFNVVLFGERIHQFQGKMANTSAKNKERAILYVKNVGPDRLEGGTAMYAGLQKALSYRPDVIILVTDGEPTDITNPIEFLSRLRRDNKRRAQVFCVGINLGRYGGHEAVNLLKRLSSQNHGGYTHVKVQH